MRVFRLCLIASFAFVLTGTAVHATERHAVYLPTQVLHITRDDSPIVRIQAEIADNAAERQHGLMFRETLPLHAGMLFIYSPPDEAAMWMKNTLIPLDMLFIDSWQRIIHIHRQAVPHSLDTISANKPVWGVLELKGGAVDALDIRLGDAVKIED